ncbi:hypothetical protein [Bifidobacterium vansinderenii]|uniref:Uncharacterized protein n=1 Tax=Bifidobacterium vansinderenii TaxID=1984871 RepID=A0A229VXN7_9BIFI|nr:hypothetical protein [Bifidobacterium vansinderenii]OXN00398.1 hypothetical protein Tam10B_1268 [Bifidobacterium vansinderenii]
MSSKTKTGRNNRTKKNRGARKTRKADKPQNRQSYREDTVSDCRMSVCDVPMKVREYVETLIREGYVVAIDNPQIGVNEEGESFAVTPWVAYYAKTEEELERAGDVYQMVFEMNWGDDLVTERIEEALRHCNAPTVGDPRSDFMVAEAVFLGTYTHVEPLDESIKEYVNAYEQAALAALRDDAPLTECLMAAMGAPVQGGKDYMPVVVYEH